MTVARWLETDSLSNQNIATAAAIGAYTADADRMIVVDVSLDQVAGAGDYVVYITRQINGAGSAYVMLPKTTCAAASGETAIAMQSGMISVRSGDVLTCYVDGLAGDTTTPDTTVRWFEVATLRPATADRTLDIAATGEASANVTLWAGDPVNDLASGNVVAQLTTTQPAIVWGQQKIVANASNEGAFDVRNSNVNGHGVYADGGNYGLRTQGGNGGQGNYGTYYGQVNSGATGLYSHGSTADVEGVDAQGIRDAMMLAPTAGDPAAGSVDKHLDDILEDTGTTLPGLIAAGVGAGTGTGYYSDTLESPAGTPVDGARVMLAIDDACVNVAYEARTDAFGVFEMHPDPGTYYRFIEDAGNSFTQGVEVTVAEP